jgi:VWFA-related protein
VRTSAGHGLLLLVLVLVLAVGGRPLPAQEPVETPADTPPPLTIQITSPVGRTGMTGPLRIVARISHEAGVQLSPVQFFVDGALVGDDRDGPPFAVEWTEVNPFERREIVAQVSDSLARSARHTVILEPLQVVERAFVSSVLVEPSVRDERGRPVNDLVSSDFRVYEDDVLQDADIADVGTVPAHYTLLVDSSQSMSRRMGFVRDAAAQLIERIRPDDSITVVPFSKTLGPITGPTTDRDTVLQAVESMQATGGTAILDCLAAVADQLGRTEGRNVIVLITDGYDENSEVSIDDALAAVVAGRITVYTVAIGGVAGVSLRGETVLRDIARQTGGQAMFPWREVQLADMHDLIASDVQQRYVLMYTPTNQRLDGRWRSIRVETSNTEHEVVARRGYTAPMPPPIQPTIELTIRDLSRQYLDVTAADLAVFEDGVEQTIDAFEESLTPVSIMLALDASGSMRRDQDAVKAAARAFAAQLPGKDRVGVVTFSDRPALTQDLSYVREFILFAIDRYTVGGGTALYDALDAALSKLRTAEGRTAIVLLTDGRDEDNPGTSPGSVKSLEEVLESLVEVGSTVYAIGLGPNVDRGTLERIAAVSSGEAYFPADVTVLGDDYRRIVENLRRRYVISYTSTNREHDGAWRNVEIRPKREGFAVEATDGYLAPDLD